MALSHISLLRRATSKRQLGDFVRSVNENREAATSISGRRCRRFTAELCFLSLTAPRRPIAFSTKHAGSPRPQNPYVGRCGSSELSQDFGGEGLWVRGKYAISAPHPRPLSPAAESNAMEIRSRGRGEPVRMNRAERDWTGARRSRRCRRFATQKLLGHDLVITHISDG